MATDKNTSSPQISLEKRYQLLVESIKDYAIYMLTPEGIIESWNAGARHFKGYTADEIIGQHFSRFYTPEDQARGLPARGLKMAATEGKFEAEGWRVRKDGTRFWAHVVIDPVRDAAGALVGFAKITRDITEKKMAQDALRASEERFRLLVQGVTDYAIYMLSPAGEITNWNTGAQRIKGYTEEDVIGSHFSRFYTLEDQAAGLPARGLQRAATEGKFEAEGWRVRKDGTRFWAHVVIDPIHNDRGEIIGFAKITRDNTEKRRAAEMLEETRAALVQSQKMEAIGKLTGGIAHDFNNLLQGILGNLDLMRLRMKMGQTGDLGKHLDAALTGVKRSAGLTHRLLAFARRQTLAPKTVDASLLVQSMMELIERTVGPDIVVEAALTKDLWWTLCDQNQLESALLNLIVNARDAMPDGGKLTIRTENLPAQQIAALRDKHLQPVDHVRLSITDTGTGMPPDIIEHVFEPFFTTKPFGEGTGLGLSMVHGFIKQSEGHITIVSAPGKGTTINLYFPRQAADTSASAADAQEKPFAVAANRRIKVLVVDDEQAVRAMLDEMLRHYGFDALTAADGHDGLRLLQTTPDIDLLITDVGLPGGMNGRQLAMAARELRPDLRILFITGYAEQALMSKEGPALHAQVLVKPFTMETFATTVQGLLTSNAQPTPKTPQTPD